jgi:hypothetical protein
MSDTLGAAQQLSVLVFGLLRWLPRRLRGQRGIAGSALTWALQSKQTPSALWRVSSLKMRSAPRSDKRLARHGVATA